MCRNIRPLFNFDPPATEQECRAAADQFVAKVGGGSKPSQVNRQAYDTAAEKISVIVATLLQDMVTKAPSKNRQLEREKLARRFDRVAR